MIGFLSRKVKILWKIFQIESTTFQICAHSKHSHSKKSIIILAFCSLSRTFATNKRVLTMANRRKCGFNSYQLKAVFTSIKARFQVNWSLHLICDASVENLYEETATTSSCLTRCSKTKSPHFNTWCGDWVYSRTPCSSQLSDGIRIFRIAVDNCTSPLSSI